MFRAPAHRGARNPTRCVILGPDTILAMDVVLADPARLEEYATLFARTFADDAMIMWPFPADAVEVRARGNWLAFGGDSIEAGWLREVAPALGIASWVPPGEADRFVEVEERSRDAIRPLTDDDGARYARLWDWIDRHLPDEPHWYLDHIAVLPERQGEGIGSALIRWGLKRATDDGACAFLETGRERNVGLYEHFGFRVVHAGEVAGGGPTVWFMRWDPA